MMLNAWRSCSRSTTSLLVCKMNIWDKYKAINESLKKEFLCVPPYRSVTPQYICDCYDKLQKEGDCSGYIVRSINLPWERAYQMEYRYKQCDIFQDFIPAIEMALYDYSIGNWLCAYLTLLPMVEALIRKLTKNKIVTDKKRIYMSDYIQCFLDEYEYASHAYYNDKRAPIKEAYLEYLAYILKETLFDNFDSYYEKNYEVVFNRNITLHKMEGIEDESKVSRNITRLFLLLDIFAEAWMLQDARLYNRNTLEIDPHSDLDFQVRFKLYVYLCTKAVGPCDIHYVYNALRGSCGWTCSEEEKKRLISQLEIQTEIYQKKPL